MLDIPLRPLPVYIEKNVSTCYLKPETHVACPKGQNTSLRIYSGYRSTENFGTSGNRKSRLWADSRFWWSSDEKYFQAI